MTHSTAISSPAGSGAESPDPVALVRGWREELEDLGAGLDDPGRVALLTALEELKGAAAAEQARVSVALDASRRAAEAAAGVPAGRQGRGVAAEIALARRESPAHGRRHLGLARVLVGEMPHALAALSGGALTEWRATLLARETALLAPEHRAAVDRALCADPAALHGLGERQLVAAARRIAYRLDPHAAVTRARRAEAERAVWLRPAPDTMAYVTALLPVAQGVAVYAALKRRADTAAGEEVRTRGQVMADTLVERVTGQTTAVAVPVAVNLVIPAAALLDNPSPGPDAPAQLHEPAHLDGHGPVPAEWARDLVRTAITTLGPRAGLAVRRLFTADGQLVALDARARRFPAGLERFIHARDAGICRTPWCGAPIRHRDHITPVQAGGATTADNGQGLCVACNHAKQAPGWTQTTTTGLGAAHTVTTTTPTGHTYDSTAPPLPGTHPPPPPADPPARALVLEIHHTPHHLDYQAPLDLPA